MTQAHTFGGYHSFLFEVLEARRTAPLTRSRLAGSHQALTTIAILSTKYQISDQCPQVEAAEAEYHSLGWRMLRVNRCAFAQQSKIRI